MLDKCEYNYWAFGHIHKREILIQDPYFAVYPGNPQGLSTKPSETCNDISDGKGCYLVEVKNFEPELTFKQLDDARFFTALPEVKKEQDISEMVNNSVKKIEDQSYLKVSFDQKKFINQMDALSIPIINYSRPVLLFLIEVDSGSKSPYFLTHNGELSELDNKIIESLNKLSSERGIFLELPVFDLQDSKDLSSVTILSNPASRISSKYNFDQIIEIKINLIIINYIRRICCYRGQIQNF